VNLFFCRRACAPQEEGKKEPKKDAKKVRFTPFISMYYKVRGMQQLVYMAKLHVLFVLARPRPSRNRASRRSRRTPRRSVHSRILQVHVTCATMNVCTVAQEGGQEGGKEGNSLQQSAYALCSYHRLGYCCSSAAAHWAFQGVAQSDRGACAADVTRTRMRPPDGSCKSAAPLVPVGPARCASRSSLSLHALRLLFLIKLAPCASCSSLNLIVLV
jgi:hypothetical protein